jgi:hypothetical protein
MVGAQRVDHEDDHVGRTRGGGRPLDERRLGRCRPETRATRPGHGEDADDRHRDGGPRQHHPPAERAAEEEGAHHDREQGPRLRRQRERPGRQLLEEHVADDAEAAHREGEHGAHPREPEREAVDPDQPGEDAGAESGGRSEGTVGDERPRHGRQLASAVRVHPHGDRLDHADDRARQQPAGETSADRVCASGRVAVRHGRASRSE